MQQLHESGRAWDKVSCNHPAGSLPQFRGTLIFIEMERHGGPPRKSRGIRSSEPGVPQLPGWASDGLGRGLRPGEASPQA